MRVTLSSRRARVLLTLPVLAVLVAFGIWAGFAWGWWLVVGGIGSALLVDLLKWVILHLGDRDNRVTYRPPF